MADVIIDTFAEHLPDEIIMLYEFLRQKIFAESNGRRHGFSDECGKTGKIRRGMFHETQDTSVRTVINLIDNDEEAAGPEELERH